MKKQKHVRVEAGTDPMRNMTGRADNNEDPFRLLPEEIVISIFNKVADLKCLCRCSLVSKHFATVIPLVQIVSLSVSDAGPYTDESFVNMRKLGPELDNCTSEQIPSVLETLSLQNLKLPNFLQKLKEVKSISLDYECPENIANFPFPTRKTKFSGNSIKLERYVGIGPRYVQKNTEVETGEEQYTDDYESACGRIGECTWRFLGHYMEWMCRILVLSKGHTSLESVTITDSEVNAELVLGHEQLGNNRELVAEMANWVISCNLSIAWVPVLHLPLLGYVLRWTTLVIISAPEDQLSSSKKLDEITDRDSEDKLMVLQEAVVEIFKNYAGEIMIGPMSEIENY